MNNIQIRPETKDDYNAILCLTYQTFLTLSFPGRHRMDEHYLIYLLRDCPAVICELCLMADLDGEIAGHILYTHSHSTRSDGP
jgi:predicted N-acetyltransferase YhbS